jgi:hypothetical protein
VASAIALPNLKLYKCHGTLRPCLVPKIFQDSSSHQIFGHIHGALNIDKKKLIIQLGRKSRDESFEPN